jgi:acyl-CoA oxidase
VLCHSGNFRIEDFRTDPMRIFAAHEVAAFADVSMATKMTVQVGGGDGGGGAGGGL